MLPIYCNSTLYFKYLYSLNFLFQIAFLGYETNHNRNFKLFSSYVGIQVITLVICMYLSIVNGHLDTLRFFFLLYSNVCYIIILTTYILFVYSVHARFSRLNDVFIRILIPKSKFGITITTPKYDLHDAVSKIGKLYEMMCDAVDSINLCFSFQVMLGLGLFFVYTIFTIFATYRLFIDYNRNLLNVLFSNIMWNLLYAMNILAILAFGSSISSDVSLSYLYF